MCVLGGVFQNLEIREGTEVETDTEEGSLTGRKEN